MKSELGPRARALVGHSNATVAVEQTGDVLLRFYWNWNLSVNERGFDPGCRSELVREAPSCSLCELSNITPFLRGERLEARLAVVPHCGLISVAFGPVYLSLVNWNQISWLG
jgi:hypothetical protein